MNKVSVSGVDMLLELKQLLLKTRNKTNRLAFTISADALYLVTCEGPVHVLQIH